MDKKLLKKLKKGMVKPPRKPDLTPWYLKKKIKFECIEGCTKCCKRPGYVYMTLEELKAIAEYLDSTVAVLKEKFIQQDDGAYYIENVDKPCTFLDQEKNKCSIYAVRPTQCQAYPFWGEILMKEEYWKEEGEFCKGIGKGKDLDMKKQNILYRGEAHTLHQLQLRCMHSCVKNFSPDVDGKCRSFMCFLASDKANVPKIQDGCTIYKVALKKCKEN